MAISSSADPVIASAPSPMARRRVLLIAVGALVAILVIAAVAATVLVRPKDTPAPARFHAAGGAFSVVVPDGWRALRGRELRAVASAPAAVLRRTDGRAVVVVHQRPALARSRRSLTSDLPRGGGRPPAPCPRAQPPLAHERPHRPARPPLHRPSPRDGAHDRAAG